MERRTFLNATLATAAVAAATPRLAHAADDMSWNNVVFTESDPGHWKAVEKLHVPEVQVDGGQLTITTPHPMSEPHYIVSHTVVLGDGTFVSRKTFNWKDKPVSQHKLPAGYKGMVVVTSTCNLHDWWVKQVMV